MTQETKMTALGSLWAYYHTVKHLSMHQIVHRLKLLAFRHLERRFGTTVLRYYTGRLKGTVTTCEPGLQQHAAVWKNLLNLTWDKERRLETAKDLLQNQFTFLNETRKLSGQALWTCKDASQLWRYQVHYFDYTVDLAIAYHVTGNQVFYDKFVELVYSWLDHNPPGMPDAWHPYPLSLRIVNLLYARSFFATPLAEDKVFRTRLEQAMALQLDYLTHHLEHDVRGNHLLKNAKALTIGGVFLVGNRCKQWRQIGLELLEREAREQVLPDGGHFERSLLYHLIVLQDLAETCIVLRGAGHLVPDELVQSVKGMTAFAREMLHPDGDIPLFGDAELIGPKRVEVVLSLAEAAVDGTYCTDSPGALNILLSGKPRTQIKSETPLTRTRAYPQTGYYVFRSGSDYLSVDCGEPCPAYLPAHAHSDMLSYELSLGGFRFIVDAGTYEYRAGKWRQLFRSTGAHNTLMVNGLEQSKPWGSFRLAERAVVLGAQMRVHGDGIESFTGLYRAPYGGQAGFIHQRSILWVDRSYWIVVDLVEGARTLEGVNRILFSPECNLQVADEIITAEHNGVMLHVIPAPGASLSMAEGWYAPHFGEIQRTTRIALKWCNDNGRLVTAYALIPGPLVPTAFKLRVQHDEVLITDHIREFAWPITRLQ